MAFSDLTFKFYTDSGLTISHSGTISPVHKTDLSDNPQDFTLYFGSAQTAGARQLQATSNPGTDYVKLTPTFNLTAWAAATAYSLGAVRRPTVANGYRYEVTVAGTSHAATEPTWPTTVGNTVTDGTVTWICRAATHPTTEVKLALTSGGLAGATPGALLNLSTTVLSGTANAIPVYVRITNTVTTVSDSTLFPELTLVMNEVVETEV